VSAAADRIRRQLERRVRAAAPELGAEILRAWDRLATQLNTADLARIIATGDVEQIFAQLLTDDVLDRAFANVQRKYFGQTTEAMEYWAHQLEKSVGTRLGFGELSPQVAEAIRTNQLRMASSLKNDVREGVRTAVALGLEEGINPRTVGRRLRETVGLTGEQVKWTHNFRRELEQGKRTALNRALARGVFRKPDGSLGYRAAHAGGVGVAKKDLQLLQRVLGTEERLTASQIDRIADAYRRRLTAWHSETLARTASLQAQKTGQHLATQQAIDDGILEADRMMSRWRTIGDSLVRDEHAAMENEVVPYGTPFSNGDVIPGQGSYNCRCIKTDFQAREPVPSVS